MVDKRLKKVLHETEQVKQAINNAEAFAKKQDISNTYYYLCNATGHLNKAREATFKK